MGYFINTIRIPPQNSADELAAACAAALAKELGWYVDTENANRVYDSPARELGFIFYVYSRYNTVTAGIFNNANYYGYSGYSSTDTGYTIFRADMEYQLCYVKSSAQSAIAVGVQTINEDIGLTSLIAANETGGRSAITFTPGTLYSLHPGNTKMKNWTASTITSLGSGGSESIATSIVRLPDVANNTMFREVYLLYSCSTVSTTNLVLQIKGKFYRVIGLRNGARMAIPVG